MAKIVVDLVAESIDDTRLEHLYRVGVDEVSYRMGHRYLTVVADHDREGAVVWIGEGKDHRVLEAFYDELGDERLTRLEAISLHGARRPPPEEQVQPARGTGRPGAAPDAGVE